MSKRRAMIVITIICMIITCVCVVKTINISKTNNITSYLSDKYDWAENDIEILDYQKGYWDYNIGFMDDSIYLKYVNPKWKLKYDDREFNAEYYHFHFADDYQLEDIFQWCTEYLQENVDKEIVGLEVCSDIIYQSPEYDYDYKLPWNNKKVFTRTDSKEIIEYISTNSRLLLFYKVDDLQNYGTVRNEQREYYIPNNNFMTFSKKKEELLKKSLKNYQLVLTDTKRFERCDFELLTGRNIICVSLIDDNELSYIKESK